MKTEIGVNDALIAACLPAESNIPGHKPDNGFNVDTKQEAKQSLFEYIEVFYNRRRRHSYLGYIIPVEYERRNAPQ
jgi:transposase InsO family protein